MTALRQLLRALVMVAWALWLLPLGDLVGHESDVPTILGRYSPSYVMLLAGYGAMALVGAAVWRAAPHIARHAPYSRGRLLLAGVVGIAGGSAAWILFFGTRNTFRGAPPAELYFTWIGWGLLFVAALFGLRATPAVLPERLTWRRHGLMAAIPTLATLVALEALVRITFPYGIQSEQYLILNPGRPNLWQPHVGNAWSSGVEFIYQSNLGFRSEIQISAEGLRDWHYPYEKPPGFYRILLLGDSMAQAVQAPLEATFHQRVESRLNAEGYAVEIISAAAGGWGTANEALYLEYEGCRYQPDLVLLAAFPTNDVGNNDRLTRFWQIRDDARSAEIFQRWIDYPYFELTDSGELIEHNVPSPQMMPQELSIGERMGTSLARFSTLYLALHQMMNPEQPPDVPAPPGLAPYYGDYPGPEPDELRSNGGVHLLTFTEPETPALAAAWRITTRLIERLREVAAGCSAELGVVIVPSYLDQTPLAEAVNTRLAQLAQSDPFWANSRFRGAEARLSELVGEMGIRYLNLIEVMSGSNQEVFLPRDGHFTAVGHEQAATAIYDWLITGNWLPAG